jgi:hypothetical protein
VEKCGTAAQATMTMWHMRFACRITEATDLHLEYATLITFPSRQWLHERASVLCYTNIACPFFFAIVAQIELSRLVLGSLNRTQLGAYTR